MKYKHNPLLTPYAKSLRKHSTKEENHLWYDFLRKYPVRFIRQKVIDIYIADFYCSDAKLVVELDGAQHYDEQGLIDDKIRTEYLEQRDLTVIRIPNYCIWNNFDGACNYIDSFVSESLRQTSSATSL